MKTLLMVIQMLPALFAGVRSIEEAVPAPKSGAEKAAFLLGLVGDVVADSAELSPLLERIIARIVALFKATGVFQ